MIQKIRMRHWILFLIPLLLIAVLAYNWLYIRILLHPFPITPSGFNQALERIQPENWQYEQIQEDLANFGRFSDQDVRNAYLKLIKNNPNRRYLYIKIKNNQVMFETLKYEYNRAVVVNALRKIAKTKSLPNCSFIVVCGESYALPEQFKFPLFSFSKDINEKSVALIPDRDALKGRHRLDSKVKRGIAKYPYDTRKSLVIWRGGLTGQRYGDRYKFVELSRQYPDIIDAKFVKVGSDPEFKKYNSDFLPLSEHLKYKYLLDLDGNVAAFSRLYWLLYSDSVCIKYASNNRQWYYKGLKDRFNYFRIDKPEQIIELVKYLDSAPKHADVVRHNATEFANNYLSNDAMAAYLYKLILMYSRNYDE